MNTSYSSVGGGTTGHGPDASFNNNCFNTNDTLYGKHQILAHTVCCLYFLGITRPKHDKSLKNVWQSLMKAQIQVQTVFRQTTSSPHTFLCTT